MLVFILPHLHCSYPSFTPTGQLFPDTDPKWKGASSDIFVKESVSDATPQQPR
jgi:2C-methyl-D-erythritol 2,4-cyclodiphosphate synthase